jgi:hypothetical protein
MARTGGLATFMSLFYVVLGRGRKPANPGSISPDRVYGFPSRRPGMTTN